LEKIAVAFSNGKALSNQNQSSNHLNRK